MFFTSSISQPATTCSLYSETVLFVEYKNDLKSIGCNTNWSEKRDIDTLEVTGIEKVPIDVSFITVLNYGEPATMPAKSEAKIE